MYRQMWLRTARDAVRLVNALPPMPVLDEFTADVTQQVMSDSGTLRPEVYRLRWLRALIALAGVMEWVNDKQLCPLAAPSRRAVWPLKEALERELGEWSPYRAAEVYREVVSETKQAEPSITARGKNARSGSGRSSRTGKGGKQ